MSFNKTKCYSVRVTHKKKQINTTYKMDDTTLEEVSSYSYLGVEITKDLNWATHINSISKKSNRILGLLPRNMLQILPTGTLQILDL